jgi:hypothetical protein
MGSKTSAGSRSRTTTPPDKSEARRSPQQRQSPQSAGGEAERAGGTDEIESRQDGDDGSDAGYETDDAASRASTSVASSVRDYGFENNRRYHKYQEGRYQFPNDEPEQEREDMKHAMIVNLCEGKLHFAPLHQPQQILDVGTGTGIWATDSESLCSFLFPFSTLHCFGAGRTASRLMKERESSFAEHIGTDRRLSTQWATSIPKQMCRALT